MQIVVPIVSAIYHSIKATWNNFKETRRLKKLIQKEQFHLLLERTPQELLKIYTLLAHHPKALEPLEAQQKRQDYLAHYLNPLVQILLITPDLLESTDTFSQALLNKVISIEKENKNDWTGIDLLQTALNAGNVAVFELLFEKLQCVPDLLDIGTCPQTFLETLLRASSLTAERTMEIIGAYWLRAVSKVGVEQASDQRLEHLLIVMELSEPTKENLDQTLARKIALLNQLPNALSFVNEDRSEIHLMPVTAIIARLENLRTKIPAPTLLPQPRENGVQNQHALLDGIPEQIIALRSHYSPHGQPTEEECIEAWKNLDALFGTIADDSASTYNFKNSQFYKLGIATAPNTAEISRHPLTGKKVTSPTVAGHTLLYYAKACLELMGPNGRNDSYSSYWINSTQDSYTHPEVFYCLWKACFDDIEHWAEYPQHLAAFEIKYKEEHPNCTPAALAAAIKAFKDELKPRYQYSAAYGLIHAFYNIYRSYNIHEVTGLDNGFLSKNCCNAGKLNVLLRFITHFNTVLSTQAIISDETISQILITELERHSEDYTPTFVAGWKERANYSNPEVKQFIITLLQNSSTILANALGHQNRNLQRLNFTQLSTFNRAHAVYCKLIRARPVTKAMKLSMLKGWIVTLNTTAAQHRLEDTHYSGILRLCLQQYFELDANDANQAQELLAEARSNLHNAIPAALPEGVLQKYRNQLGPKTIDETSLVHILRRLKNLAPAENNQLSELWLNIIDAWALPNNARTPEQRIMAERIRPVLNRLFQEPANNFDISSIEAVKEIFLPKNATQKAGLLRQRAQVALSENNLEDFQTQLISLLNDWGKPFAPPLLPSGGPTLPRTPYDNSSELFARAKSTPCNDGIKYN